MAYNTNTRLLLKFNGANGATTTTDTSASARAVTLSGSSQISSVQGVFSSNALEIGVPGGSGSVGDVRVDTPGSVFSTSTSNQKTFDFWFWRDANSSWGIHPLISIQFQNGDTFMVWRGANTYELELNSAATNGEYTYQSYPNYTGYQTWVHGRVAVAGADIYVAIDGTEIMHAMSANSYDLWVGGSGNPVTEFRIGAWPTSFNQDANVFARGYFDAYQVLEGDTSWFGGSYTVPSAEPDDSTGASGVSGLGSNTTDAVTSIGAGVRSSTHSLFRHAVRLGAVDLFIHRKGDTAPVLAGAFWESNLAPALSARVATGSNTVEDLVSAGSGNVAQERTGAGANTTDAVTSTGGGVVLQEVVGAGGTAIDAVTSTGDGLVLQYIAGANTVDNVTSTGTGLLGNDLYTTLMLHGNTAGLTADSSIYAQTTIAQNIAQSYATPLYGDGAMGFSNPSGGTGGSQIRLDLTGALFSNPTQDKIIDFSLAQDPTGYTGGDVFRLDFPVLGLYSASNSYIRFETNTEFLRARLYVLTPNTNSLLTLALPAADARIRIAFIGSNLYVCYNGVQVGTLAGEGAAPYTLWPQTVACSSFVIGGNATSFKGKLDEFRIQEGSVTNHGYAGGDYTVDTAEWCPLRTLGAGSNTVEAITSTGSGTVAPVIYGTSSTQLQDVTGDGWGSVGVFIQGTGTQTLEDVTSLGLGILGAIVYGTGTGVVEDIVAGESSGSLYWAGRGSSILDSIVGTGEGVVGAGVSANNGANTVQDILSTGIGSILIRGSGATTVEVSSSGTGIASTQGYGANTVSVNSLGSGVIPVVGAGSNIASVLSSGTGTILLQGYGQSSVDVFSNAQGFILITGRGANTLDDIYAFVEANSLAEYGESVSVFLPPHRGHVRTSTPSFWVRQ